MNFVLNILFVILFILLPVFNILIILSLFTSHFDKFIVFLPVFLIDYILYYIYSRCSYFKTDDLFTIFLLKNYIALYMPDYYTIIKNYGKKEFIRIVNEFKTIENIDIYLDSPVSFVSDFKFYKRMFNSLGLIEQINKSPFNIESFVNEIILLIDYKIKDITNIKTEALKIIIYEDFTILNHHLYKDIYDIIDARKKELTRIKGIESQEFYDQQHEKIYSLSLNDHVSDQLPDIPIGYKPITSLIDELLQKYEKQTDKKVESS